MDKRFIDVEIAISDVQKAIEDLNEEVIRQGKIIDFLLKQNEYFKNALLDNNIKPLDEESQPPHY